MMGLQEVVTWCHLERGSESFVGGSGAWGCWQFVSGGCFLQFELHTSIAYYSF